MRACMFVRIGVVIGLVAFVLGGCQFDGDMFKAKFTRSEDLTAPLAGITTLDVQHERRQDPDRRRPTSPRSASRPRSRSRPARRKRRRSLAEQVRIVAEPSGQTLRIKAIKPAGLGRNELSVDFTITAPAALALRVRDERRRHPDRRLRRPGRGPHRCRHHHLHGSARRRRSAHQRRRRSGGVRIRRPGRNRSVDASTNVGSIELAGPKDISAKLTAETNVGAINTDRPLTVTGSLKRSIRASLGNGEGRINLRTNVGSIRIR